MIMKSKMLLIPLFMVSLAFEVQAAESTHAHSWYVGDEHCQPPENDGTYSPPYKALDHKDEYPTFTGADKPGWSCSYQRDDGVIVQYGDSRTPQEQWLDLWGNNGLND